MKKIFFTVVLLAIIVLMVFGCKKAREEIEKATIEETISKEEYGHTPDFVPHDEEPIVFKRVEPEYPDSLKVQGIGGVVVLKVEVLKNGSVGAVKIVKNLQEDLDKFAIEALKQWEFTPAKNNGVPVSVWITIPIRFGEED